MRYDYSLIRESQKLFPDATSLHSMMKAGDPKAVDFVYSKIGFYIDEDDILRVFRNKKEQNLIEMAKRAKAIRELYQKMYLQVSSSSIHDSDE